MKKLLSLLAAVALFPVAANADVLSNVNLKGDIQVITSDVNHSSVVPANAYNRGTSARVLAGLSADLVEDVTANLMFQYANIWGADNASGKTTQNYWDNIRLVEANVVLHNLFCCLDATVGRQFYGDEDSAVMYFGPNHYNAEFNGYTSSVDAAKISYSDDFKTFTFIAGKTNDTAVGQAWTGNIGVMNAGAPFPANEYDVFGADLKLNLSDEVKAQVYGYDFNGFPRVGAVGTDRHFGFYGAKVTVDTPVRFAVEYARNFGGDTFIREHHDTGHMIKADVAADVEVVTLRGTALYANENFRAFGNYTPGLLIGHRLGGAINGYSIDGVTLFNLGADVKPADKWTVSFDVFSFQDHRLDHSATYEGDVTVKYAHNEYVELFAGAGYANYTKWVGTAFNKDTFDKDNVKGQLGMLIKF